MAQVLSAAGSEGGTVTETELGDKIGADSSQSVVGATELSKGASGTQDGFKTSEDKGEAKGKATEGKAESGTGGKEFEVEGGFTGISTRDSAELSAA